MSASLTEINVAGGVRKQERRVLERAVRVKPDVDTEPGHNHTVQFDRPRHQVNRHTIDAHSELAERHVTCDSERRGHVIGQCLPATVADPLGPLRGVQTLVACDAGYVGYCGEDVRRD